MIEIQKEIQKQINAGDNKIPFSQQAFELINKRVHYRTILRWKKAGYIPTAYFSLDTPDEKLRKHFKGIIKHFHLPLFFDVIGYSLNDYRNWLNGQLKLTYSEYCKVEAMRLYVKERMQAANTEKDVQVLLIFVNKSVLGLSNFALRKLKKPGKALPEIINALNIKAEIL